MQKWSIHFTFAAIFLAAICSSKNVFAGESDVDIEDRFLQAMAAYDASDYVTAGRLLKSLAEQGHVVSQRMLGSMYDKGRGVPQNFYHAVSWFQKAARQNDPVAQYHLGLKYANGQGVVLNPTEAYVWFAISFNNGYELAANPLRVLNKSLSTVDRQEALKVVVQKMEVFAR